jgi:pSer/pThr/pTyr-binding forkhead associated (FHA) protein
VDVPEAKYEVLDGSVIGRTGSINVSMLPRADVISREHCRFHGNAGRCTMEVLKPVNGTYLNNQPLPPGAVVPLSDGDRVTLANTTFVFRVVQ